MIHSETLDGYLIEIPLSFHEYNVIQYLDSGATSVIYLIEDSETKEKYSAKVMSKKDNENKKTMTSILNEIKILQELDHPNIIKIKEVFEIENKNEEYIIIIMENCENGDLLSYANNIGFKNEAEKKKIICGFLEAIKYLHKKEISHGDIKLENILLDKKLSPKLCDFGFCRKSTVAGEEAKNGTLFYAAPELLVKGQFNPLKTDIWAIGIALYSISELQFPFKEINQYYIIQQILNGRLTISENLNKKLRTLVERCTSFNPSNRPTVDDILHDDYFLDVDDGNNNNSCLQKENNKANKIDEKNKK